VVVSISLSLNELLLGRGQAVSKSLDPLFDISPLPVVEAEENVYGPVSSVPT
jgi:hypothetical protein